MLVFVCLCLGVLFFYSFILLFFYSLFFILYSLFFYS
ncbi:putative membrane protein, partial [Helicobacter pylori Hp H-42]